MRKVKQATSLKPGQSVFVETCGGKKVARRGVVERSGNVAWWVRIEARAHDESAHVYAKDDAFDRGLLVEVGVTDCLDVVHEFKCPHCDGTGRVAAGFSGELQRAISDALVGASGKDGEHGEDRDRVRGEGASHEERADPGRTGRHRRAPR